MTIENATAGAKEEVLIIGGHFINQYYRALCTDNRNLYSMYDSQCNLVLGGKMDSISSKTYEGIDKIMNILDQFTKIVGPNRKVRVNFIDGSIFSNDKILLNTEAILLTPQDQIAINSSFILLHCDRENFYIINHVMKCHSQSAISLKHQISTYPVVKCSENEAVSPSTHSKHWGVNHKSPKNQKEKKVDSIITPVHNGPHSTTGNPEKETIPGACDEKESTMKTRAMKEMPPNQTSSHTDNFNKNGNKQSHQFPQMGNDGRVIVLLQLMDGLSCTELNKYLSPYGEVCTCSITNYNTAVIEFKHADDASHIVSLGTIPIRETPIEVRYYKKFRFNKYRNNGRNKHSTKS